MEKKMLRVVFVLYVLLSGYTIAHHELWGDEVHSWNISKGSGSYPDLIHNRRFEGHPPGWYTVLWTISRFSHNMAWMQAVQWVFACTVIFVVLFHSPFPFLTRVLIPFGYFFLYEYAVFSRNYIIGILLIFCICMIMRKEFRGKLVLYYTLLFLASNFHLLAVLLAISLHAYFLLLKLEQKKSVRWLLTQGMIGALLFLPAAHFIFPPSDSALNMHVWFQRWNKHQLTASIEVPLRAFLPVPAWWNYNFWNTQFLQEAKAGHPFLKVVNLLVSAGLVSFGFYVLRSNIKCVALYGVNLFLSFFLAVAVLPLTVTRYSGFVFIGFIAAYWLYCYEKPPARVERGLVDALLSIHILAGLFAVIREIQLPFANLYKVPELMAEVPSNERLVSDYWTMNAVSAYTDKPAYCVDLGKSLSFVLWDPDVSALQRNQFRYTTGMQDLMAKEGLKTVYMISLGSPGVISKTDAHFFTSYHIDVVDRKEGALEKGSNIYLYKVSPL